MVGRLKKDWAGDIRLIFLRKSGHNEELAGGAGIELERLNPVMIEAYLEEYWH